LQQMATQHSSTINRSWTTAESSWTADGKNDNDDDETGE
jgi:hypothetical protein